MAVGKLAALALAGAVALPLAPAHAQIYPGWDFGGGIGIGIGPPPSAYTPCPTYGWPYYPYPCTYHPVRRVHHNNAAHCRRRHIDVVNTHASASDDAQL